MSNRFCPFCNCESRLAVVRDGNGENFYYRVCTNCGCRTDAWRSREKADSMWNTRYESDLVGIEIARIIDDLKKIPTRSISIASAIRIIRGEQLQKNSIVEDILNGK